MEKDEKLKNKNIKFYEKLLKVKRKRKSSGGDQDNSHASKDINIMSMEEIEIQDLIEENGGFFYLLKGN